MRKIIKKFVLSMFKINILLTNLKEQKYCTDLFGDDDYIKSFDFLKNISEIAESKNYGIKYPKYKQDNYKSL